MDHRVAIVGAGLAGTEAALQLGGRGIGVDLYEMRPGVRTPVHRTAQAAELVCSNSLKSTKPASAAGMLKSELAALGSKLYGIAQQTAVPAGGALAVDRDRFAQEATKLIDDSPNITRIEQEVQDILGLLADYDAVILASGPLTSDALSASLASMIGSDHLAFYDAVAPIVMADSLDADILFRQSRYEDEGAGDYLNAPFTKEEYEHFIEELLGAKRVIARDFETAELFNACQPIEEIARTGLDAPRFGPLKPVGLTDPRTGKRPWAALQLRAENLSGTSYNLVGFQTNLTFPEQARVFRMIPGLENAEFARYGVMHRNTFIDAPRWLDRDLRLKGTGEQEGQAPLHIAGQLGGTEGYCEAIRSGLHAALAVEAHLKGIENPRVPKDTAFGALLAHCTDPQCEDYQPMHVNFGIVDPLDPPVKQKAARYEAYAKRGQRALEGYLQDLTAAGLREVG